ncbi:hypothetical protein, partial [Limosilactobacillus reuteri]|uniref:hypothetical protein n=1 Tax=Limosilactobacillus reuteri TaxID=1598 RepID=UPI002B060EF2
FFAVVKKRTRRMSRIENPREAIKDGSTGIFYLSITCQYGLLTKNLFTDDNLSIGDQEELGLDVLLLTAY